MTVETNYCATCRIDSEVFYGDSMGVRFDEQERRYTVTINVADECETLWSRSLKGLERRLRMRGYVLETWDD